MRHPDAMTVTEAQNDLRRAYRDGAPGVLAEEPHRTDSTGTDEFALIDPEGYDVMVSADGPG